MGYRVEHYTCDGKGSDKGSGKVKGILWLILFLNVAVALTKLVYGVFSNSVSIQADGFHSLFDGASNVLGLVGLTVASRPADKEHPYGHSKYETYAAAGIGAMLVVAAYKIGYAAVEKLLTASEPASIDFSSFAVMVSTLIVNIFVAWYEGKKGRELKSDILIADAKHTSSDIAVTIGVIIGLAFVKLGYPKADPIIALMVSVAILHTAWEVFQRADVSLSDRARLDTHAIEAAVMLVEGVKGCHSIRTRGTSSSIHVDMHVQVDSRITVREGHEIAEEVERHLCDCVEGVVDVIVHLEPMDEYQAQKTAKEKNGEILQ